MLCAAAENMLTYTKERLPKFKGVGEVFSKTSRKV